MGVTLLRRRATDANRANAREVEAYNQRYADYEKQFSEYEGKTNDYNAKVEVFNAAMKKGLKPGQKYVDEKGRVMYATDKGKLREFKGSAPQTGGNVWDAVRNQPRNVRVESDGKGNYFNVYERPVQEKPTFGGFTDSRGSIYGQKPKPVVYETVKSPIKLKGTHPGAAPAAPKEAEAPVIKDPGFTIQQQQQLKSGATDQAGLIMARNKGYEGTSELAGDEMAGKNSAFSNPDAILKEQGILARVLAGKL
jgi:hypothetical protein